MVKFHWKKIQTFKSFKKHKSSTLKRFFNIKKKKINTLRQLFNIKSKNYQPYFKRNNTLHLQNEIYFIINKNILSPNAINLVQTKHLNKKNTPKYFYNFYNIDLNNPRVDTTDLILKNNSYKIPLSTNNNIYAFNVLVDYLLSSYLLHKKNIHSKKASIIIAQIVDAGHFARRNVYLSTTQSVFLKYTVKLTNYVNHYLPYPSLLDLKTLVNSNIQSLEWNFCKKVNDANALSASVTPWIRNFKFFDTIFINTMKFIWIRSVFFKTKTKLKFHKRYNLFFRSIKKLLSKKSLTGRRYKKNFYRLKYIIKTHKRNKINFLWQKKKNYRISNQRKYLRFFKKFSKLPITQKYNIRKSQSLLSPQLTFNRTFINFDYSSLNLKQNFSKKSPYFNTLNSMEYFKVTPQVSILFLMQPWLLATINQNNLNSALLFSFAKSSSISFEPSYSNLQPHKSFKYVISKKVLSLFSTNRIREDIIPLYYNTLIRFMEHCSGKKIFLQLYPFLNQDVSYNYIVRYKSWITRMKSYERRLGHKFFFEEALHIMHLSFTLRDSLLFSSWLKAMILRISFWKTRTIFRFLRYLFLIYFMHIFPELKIKGLKIRLKGKISAAGNSRKRTILYRVGQTSHSNLDLRVSHSKKTINTFTGVMGFQVWLFY